MSQLRVATTPRQLPSEIDETNRKPWRIATMICSSPAKSKHRDAPYPRLTKPEMIAASCSADARSSELDAAMRRPSDETATASVTPAVWSTKLLSSQLKLRASSLRLISPRSCRSWILLWGGVVPGLVETALNARCEAGQEAVDVSCRAVVMLLAGVDVPVAVAIPVPTAGGGRGRPAGCDHGGVAGPTGVRRAGGAGA